MSPRRLAAAACLLSVVGAVALTAEAAGPPKGASTAPTVAYHGALVTSTTQPAANRAISYRGTPLRFAETVLPRDTAEPTIGVNKAGTVYVPTLSFDSRASSDARRFPRTVVYQSRDGGRSFKPLPAGVGGTEGNEVTFDPYVYVDPDFGRAFNVDLLLAGTAITFTDDNGETFGTGFANVAGANDHQTLVAGVPPKGNPRLVPTDPSFPKIVYYCVNTIARIACANSTDGGRTYVEAGTSPSQPVATSGSTVCGSLHGHVVTDLDGRLFLPRNECGRLVLGVSEDGGLTWSTRTVATTLGAGDPDTSVVADRLGNLYYTWYDEKFRLPYLVVSRDHGLTWSKPRMIAPPGVHAVNFPTVDVGDPGKLALFFPGSPEDDARDKARAWNYYAVVTTDALSDNPTFVSTITNKPGDPVHRGECDGRCGRVYDFVDVVVAPNDQGRMWAPGVDTCIGECSTKRLAGFQPGLTADDHGASGARRGVVYRQISGPALRGTKALVRDTRG